MAFGNFFSCKIQWVVPSVQESSIFPNQVANHSVGFYPSSLLPRELVIINTYMYLSVTKKIRLVSYVIAFYPFCGLEGSRKQSLVTQKGFEMTDTCEG